MGIKLGSNPPSYYAAGKGEVMKDVIQQCTLQAIYMHVSRGYWRAELVIYRKKNKKKKNSSQSLHIILPDSRIFLFFFFFPFFFFTPDR